MKNVVIDLKMKIDWCCETVLSFKQTRLVIIKSQFLSGYDVVKRTRYENRSLTYNTALEQNEPPSILKAEESSDFEHWSIFML